MVDMILQTQMSRYREVHILWTSIEKLLDVQTFQKDSIIRMFANDL